MKRLSVIGTTLRSRPHARYPLSRVPDAHRELEISGVVGKLLLLPSPPAGA